MKKIKLTKGYYCLINNKDYNKIRQYTWRFHPLGYAQTTDWNNGKPYGILMHREIMGLKRGDRRQVDHINGNKLDNQKENLRIVNNAQNNQNVPKQKNNKSGYKGVCLNKQTNKYYSQITFNGKRKCLGHYKSKIDAAHAYDKAAIQYHGEFANLNFPRTQYGTTN